MLNCYRNTILAFFKLYGEVNGVLRDWIPWFSPKIREIDSKAFSLSLVSGRMIFLTKIGVPLKKRKRNDWVVYKMLELQRWETKEYIVTKVTIYDDVDDLDTMYEIPHWEETKESIVTMVTDSGVIDDFKHLISRVNHARTEAPRKPQEKHNLRRRWRS